MKIFLGGSAVLTTALLTASFVFYVPTQTLSKSLEQEQKQEQNQIQQANNNNSKQEEINKEKSDNKNAHSNNNDSKSTEPTTEKLIQANYSATAYALRGRTASGRGVARGLIAADPRVLPIGSKVRVEAGNWTGEYVVADTGARIKGKKVDIWVPSNGEARQFGRRTVKLTVLTYGKRPANKTTANTPKQTTKQTAKKTKK